MSRRREDNSGLQTARPLTNRYASKSRRTLSRQIYDICFNWPEGEVPSVLSKIDFAQYVFRPLSYTYTSVLSKTFSYKNSSTSSAEAFVASAAPAVAVISATRDSPYGHPHPEVLKRWRGAGARVLTTAEHGMVTVSTDGEDLLVETFVRP